MFKILALLEQPPFSLLCSVLCGILLLQITQCFLPLSPCWYKKALVVGVLGACSTMPSWIGDENTLIIFPFFLFSFYFCFDASKRARLICACIFYTVFTPVGMIIDSIGAIPQYYWMILAKIACWILLWVFFRLLKKEKIDIPAKLWLLIGCLELAPLMASLAFPLWNLRDISDENYVVVLQIAFTTLPFVFLSSVTLLFAIRILSQNEQTQQAYQLLILRENYYQNLQLQQQQLRTLRHDMHNHIAAAQGLLEQGENDRALAYLQAIATSSALESNMHFCQNEIANVVLSAKFAELTAKGLTPEFDIALPPALLIADMDLCALLGNALDNAMEAAVSAQNKTVLVRVRADKGLFMLRVQNHYLPTRPPQPSLPTTKPDKTAHGFGLASMRQVAARYGGSLEIRAESGVFELIVCFSLWGK